MKVYPYRQDSGHRSILEATDLDDAKDWLSAGYGPTELCEVEMDNLVFRKTIFSDNDSLVDYLLETSSETYTVGK